MAAFDHALIARSAEHLVYLSKRKNWAHKNPGVILVFCIVGIVAFFVIALLVSKKLAARKAARPAKA